CLQVLEVPFTF
nr:immunoglobulin light chain junction region [Macaca mulatta]MOX08688.1 immunoglobulin light chain junction region [Macaca mulatta]MOX10527.1 immunoglobulin light chain junction region [Macaca mulatta]